MQVLIKLKESHPWYKDKPEFVAKNIWEIQSVKTSSQDELVLVGYDHKVHFRSLQSHIGEVKASFE